MVYIINAIPSIMCCVKFATVTMTGWRWFPVSVCLRRTWYLVILPRASSDGNTLHLTSSDVLAMLSSTAGTPTGTATHQPTFLCCLLWQYISTQLWIFISICVAELMALSTQHNSFIRQFLFAHSNSKHSHQCHRGWSYAPRNGAYISLT